MNTNSVLLIAAASLFLAACDGQPRQAGTSSGNPLTAPADYVGAIGNAQNSARKTIGSVGLDQAIKGFFAQEGRLPKDLGELTAKGFQIPPEPAGMKWSYDPATGIVKPVAR